MYEHTVRLNVCNLRVDAAIAMLPALRVEMLPQYLRLMTVECLREVTTRYFPDDEFIEQDIEVYASGALFKRNRGLAKPLGGTDFWRNSCPATSLVKTYKQMEKHASGSGSAERKFGVHERVHDKKRGRLGEDSCEAQIAVNDYSNEQR